MIRMGKKYSGAVGDVLMKYQLDYIPEAHNYLRIQDEIVDCTTIHASADRFIHELISEIEIEPAQITDFKVHYHQAYLREWLAMQPGLSMSFEKLWKVREECIVALGSVGRNV